MQHVVFILVNLLISLNGNNDLCNQNSLVVLNQLNSFEIMNDTNQTEILDQLTDTDFSLIEKPVTEEDSLAIIYLSLYTTHQFTIGGIEVEALQIRPDLLNPTEIKTAFPKENIYSICTELTKRFGKPIAIKLNQITSQEVEKSDDADLMISVEIKKSNKNNTDFILEEAHEYYSIIWQIKKCSISITQKYALPTYFSKNENKQSFTIEIRKV